MPGKARKKRGRKRSAARRTGRRKAARPWTGKQACSGEKAGDRGGAAMDREGGMQRDGSMRGGAAELGAAMEAGVPPQELAAKAVAQRGPVEALMSAMRQMPEGMEKPRKSACLPGSAWRTFRRPRRG